MDKAKMYQPNCKQSHSQAELNENVTQNDGSNESEWQWWQSSYSARRGRTFADIVEALKQRLAPVL